MYDEDDPEEILEEIKKRARDRAFSYAGGCFERMVEQSLYEEDIQRAFSNATLDGIIHDSPTRTSFALSGFGMNEETLLLHCRLSKTRLVVMGVDRAPELPELP
jgi:hypothetical protein